MTDSPAIRFEGVTKHFPGNARPSVDGVSLDVPTGELVVLLGPSGCGKTTLLRLVNRLLEPTGGRVWVQGADVATVPPVALRRGIGYVIQQVGLFPHMRVGRNVAVVPRLLGWPEARTAARVTELLTLVGLPPAEYRDRYPAELSGGEQQRVGLARALAADPPILLMDEPFAAIDALTRRRLQTALRDIQQRLRKTILFVTHDVEEALYLADRIAVLRAGTVLQYDTPLALLSRPADPFVARLLGADDALRRLSLLPVSLAAEPAALTPQPPSLEGKGESDSPPPLGEGPGERVEPLDPDDTLRHALTRLLAEGRESLPVAGGSRITLEAVRRLAAHGTAPPEEPEA